MSTESEHAFLQRVLRGDRDAVRFVELLAGISQIWDDLVDRDKPVAAEQVNSAFIAALVHLPRDPFYLRHFQELQPVIEQAIVDWLTANEFEKKSGTLHEKRLAFVLRSAMTPVVIRVATIVGGMAWARAVAPEIRRFCHDEAFEDVMGES